MGWDNVFHCEWNEFGQKILKHYWPNAKSYTDITKTDFSIHRGTIDILTGGFPCQPYSTAGKRLGKEDDRHLWPEMLRAIREIKPQWVVGENVFGLTNWNGGMVFDEVQTDLEAEGYEVQAYVLPACAVNAPHRRDRVWFVAHSNSSPTRSSRTSGEPESGRSDYNDESCSRRESSKQYTGRGNVLWDDPNPVHSGLQGDEQFGVNQKEDCRRRTSAHWAIAKLCRSNHWAEWPTQSPLCTGDDELPSRLDGIAFPKWRNESIKAGGNAVVPLVVYQIFKAINAYNHLKS